MSIHRIAQIVEMLLYLAMVACAFMVLYLSVSNSSRLLLPCLGLLCVIAVVHAIFWHRLPLEVANRINGIK